MRRNQPDRRAPLLSFVSAHCYRLAMDQSSPPTVGQHLRRIYGWPRLRVVLPVCLFWIAMFSMTWEVAYWILAARILFIGLSALTIFGIFEYWPRRLPGWVARWVVQVVMVGAIIPVVVAIGYTVTTIGLDPPWWRDNPRLEGFFVFTFLGMLQAPWISVAALLKKIKNEALTQALTFDLERSQYEKQALNARLRLLQAQVEPHFLFNTLANVRELVITGSPHAPKVLNSLIAYLRAAVPRLNQPMANMGQELDLVRAYLEVMHMRMPDRLQFTLHADESARALLCPPMTLLTLVENAMRHGIDPAEEGGRIDIRVILQGTECVAEVVDTGLGVHKTSEGLGTGLANLRERLQLAFGDDATVMLTPVQPRGTLAVVRFPVKRGDE